MIESDFVDDYINGAKHYVEPTNDIFQTINEANQELKAVFPILGPITKFVSKFANITLDVSHFCLEMNDYKKSN